MIMKALLAVLAGVVAATPAYAQYYQAPPPPPPGYYPPPGYDRPPPGYESRREYEEEREFDRARFGRRCDAVLRTPEGPRHLICRIVRPKLLGEECACPPPPPPPGYDPGPFIGGRTVR